MLVPSAQKNHLFSLFITIFITIQAAACSTEEGHSAEQENTGPTTEIDIGINENSAAEISGTDTGSVTEDLDPDGDLLLEVSGTLTITDSDTAEASFLSTTTNGDYGLLTIDSTGNWHYSVENNLVAIQNLTTGSTLTDLLTVSSIDGTHHQITITILGVNEINQPAIISGTDTGSVTEDIISNSSNTLFTSGKLNITDGDNGEEVFIALSKNTNFGSFIMYTSGLWIYATNNNLAIIQNLANGQFLTDSIGTNSIDGTAHTVTITINGADEPNTPAIITGMDSGSVTKNLDPDNDNLLEVSGTLNITDPDSSEAIFNAANITGNYGNLTINTAGNWTYAANNNQNSIQNLDSNTTLTDILTISSADSTTHSVTITINGVDESNTPAIITGIDSGNVTEDIDPDNDNLLEVGGKLNITDANSGEAVFNAASITGNYGNLTIDTAGNWAYAANNNQNSIQNLDSNATLTDAITISSADNTTHTIFISINGTDETNTTADITLSWTAPSEREDNTAITLAEIAGYKIYYGTTQGQYGSNITINSGTATNHLFEDFTTDTYYFVITTLDTSGRESQRSAEVQKSN